ncbi:MAG: transport-associated protein [Herpetosiphonaceae bacterium]|nr:MAG: transport-associated protein [Herpetosiphonaceae bacterium]
MMTNWIYDRRRYWREGQGGDERRYAYERGVPYFRGYLRQDITFNPDLPEDRWAAGERGRSMRFTRGWGAPGEDDGAWGYSGRRDDRAGDYGREARSLVEFWRFPGPFTGIGPRGYRRSDAAIYEDVCHLLTWHGQIDASDIEIRVERGEVTLIGSVDSRENKRRAEDVAESVAGVVDIHNRLRIRQPGQGPQPPRGPQVEQPHEEPQAEQPRERAVGE